MASDLKNTNDGNTYLNDPESGAEMLRLLDQDRTLTRCMGGLFAEQSGVEGLHDVLDIACGPGGWVQELAFSYPQIEVTGIDISKAMIEYAQMQARTQHLDNAHFFVMDATKPLDFPDGSFDLVNARTIAGFMRTSDWPALVQEGVRILRPGGILRLTDTDLWGKTNSPAFEQLYGLVARAVFLNGHSFDPSGQTNGITPMLERLLTRAGFKSIGARAHAINFSTGAVAHQAMYQNARVFFKLVQPFLLKTRSAFPEAGIPGQEELDRLYERALLEMMEDDFVAIFYLLTAWGVKP
jgi:ubiquinone/menaquinone biosynthesis C-methylase UbiE